MRARDRLLLLALSLTVAWGPSRADDADQASSTVQTSPTLYRLIKRFDFDERPLGNFEDTPIHWRQLRGPTLPHHGLGKFDESVGATAPPSFRLTQQTDNVGFEYAALDIPITPNADYLIRAKVRAERVVHSRAFLATYLMDRFGQRIPGSERVSNLVRSTGAAEEPWQDVRIETPGEFPAAFALHLTLWILQTRAFASPSPLQIDPIQRQDILASACFDDIEIYRLPRSRLLFSSPACLVPPGESRELLVEMNNAAASPLPAEITIFNERGVLVHTAEVAIPATEERAWFAAGTPERDDRGDERLATVSSPIPPLPAGQYVARLRLTDDGATLIERRLRFAVLPELTTKAAHRQDFGVDVGRCVQCEPRAGAQLAQALGAGSVKIGLPLGIAAADRVDQFADVSEFIRELTAAGIDPVGVMLPPDPASGATIRLIRENPAWPQLLSPILAYFGGALPTWQLGSEGNELTAARVWSPEEVDSVRSTLRRFLTLPQLIVPRPCSDPLIGPDTMATLLPADLPTRDAPRALEFLRQAPETWLAIEPPQCTSDTDRLAELTRRVVLGHAMQPQRLYVPAPFTRDSLSGTSIWQPTSDYVPLRTLMHALSGKRMIASVTPEERVLGILFEGGESSCAVFWNWGASDEQVPLDLYLGPAPQAYDLWGAPLATPVHDGKTRLLVPTTPIIVQNLDVPLALLHASYSLSPRFLEVHGATAPPVLRLRNPYSSPIHAVVRLNGPRMWRITPAAHTFDLAPGAWLELPLRIELPPRQVASGETLEVELELLSPQLRRLRFEEAIQVGLRDVEVQSQAHWEGDALVVEQSLRNASASRLSFTAFCDAPDQPRVETLFREIPPGAVAVRSYVFPGARGMSGARVRTGIQEIHGPRTLFQLVQIPE